MKHVGGPALDAWPRYFHIPLLALAIQIVAIHILPGVAPNLKGGAFIASYLLLLAFIILNCRCWGILITGIGLALNFVAIAANGGFMPVTPESATRSGLTEKIALVNLGGFIPGSKHILLDKASSKLWLLSDIISIKAPVGRVFSIGDVLIGIGVIVFLIRTTLLFLGQRKASQAHEIASLRSNGTEID